MDKASANESPVVHGSADSHSHATGTDSRGIFALENIKPFARRHWPAIVLFAVTVVMQIVFFSHAEPNVFPDSNAYADLGRVGWAIPSQMNFRTPGYPLFIKAHFELFGRNAWRTVMATQFLAGTFIPLLLYAIFLPIVKRPGIAAWGGAGFLFDRYSVMNQTVPLTEYPGSVLLLASLAAFLWAIPKKRWWAAVATGFVFYLMCIVRPSFALLPHCLLGSAFVVELLYPQLRPHWKRAAVWYCLVFLSFQVGMWGRCWSVYKHTGYFTMSNQLGLSLTNHTGGFMELAPDKYAKLRDIYVRHRNARNGDYINLADNIDWQAETGKPLWVVSHEFREMGKYLILHNFGRYLGQVQKNWVRIWTDSPFYLTDIYDPYSGLRGRTALFSFIATSSLLRNFYTPLEMYFWSKKNALLAVPFVLLGFGAVALYLRRSSTYGVIAILSIVGAVFYHVILHIAIQGTEFGRYKLPAQTLWFSTLVLMVAWLIATLAGKVRQVMAPAEAVKKAKPTYGKSRNRSAGKPGGGKAARKA